MIRFAFAASCGASNWKVVDLFSVLQTSGGLANL